MLTVEADKLRKLAIISLFSDDELMDILVLKGGNALNIAYKINDRASMDIDLSMGSDFEEDLESIKARIVRALVTTYGDEGYQAFDIDLVPRPIKMSEAKKEFWGGYALEFKVVKKEVYETFKDDHARLQNHAMIVGANNRKKIEVEISRFEVTRAKRPVELDGYIVYVYTPLMIALEKLRAICQQMDVYVTAISTHKKPRARDFFDIYSVIEAFPGIKEEILQSENLELLEEIFNIKKVPIELLNQIENEREYHRDNFQAVKNTVSAKNIEDYDFYFDYVVALAAALNKARKGQVALTQE
ncbi:nucleotidyl transferase AbiEii/AbiGii toxin family protein (plasmid) [Brevibacillus sp. M2.1A]|uniref:nucleotidyl transferase AbiEii/AbiGii toxin family protein n=2 Tax=Brevibacillus TaxID=55080 RepID=UPI00156B3DEA|nr:nucleotidyl transferase AbiEii/AbiGii toxin family protein [Brevibacillus sp. M2.1A]MCC8438715.1 nucleotidyl transferase AbiEii/AbiGii toxin family protein [Brevibacillus sp. M2.1A]